MSDLGLISHAYGRWNQRLAEYNRWLLRTRMARDGYDTEEEDFSLNEKTRQFIEEVRNALRSAGGQGGASSLPNTIQERVRSRLENELDEAEASLSRLLGMEQIVPQEIDEETIRVLRAILSSLSDEVSELHSRMRPRR